MIVVGLSGFEPLTSRLSGVRSNQLSYRPIKEPVEVRLKTKPSVSGSTTKWDCLKAILAPLERR
jgi:hypothetical protein